MNCVTMTWCNKFSYLIGLSIWLVYFSIYGFFSIGMCLLYAVLIPLIQPSSPPKKLQGSNIQNTSNLPNPTSYWVIFLLLPTNIFSKLWGKIESIPLPIFMRRPLFELWARATGCLLDEMSKQIEEYTCLDDFFTRKLKPECRPIAESDLVSPCDAKVLSYGELDGDKLRHVKGFEYPLKTFLGREIFSAQSQAHVPNKKYLNHIILYLSPGDCHRYISPTTWEAEHRTHFPGGLYSVAPSLLRFISGLFAINERVILSGTWNPEGSESRCNPNRFVMAFVGALNVGSIELKFDSVRTNNLSLLPDMKQYDKHYESKVQMKRGEEIGMFHLGSTIVLLFETDRPFQFSSSIKVGNKVKFGQSLQA